MIARKKKKRSIEWPYRELTTLVTNENRMMIVIGRRDRENHSLFKFSFPSY